MSNEATAAGWADWKPTAADIDDYGRMLRHVRAAEGAVGAAGLSVALSVSVQAAQRLLSLAAGRGEVVQVAKGLYRARDVADIVAASPVPIRNLSRAAASRFQPRNVVTASGRAVTVAPELIRDQMTRARTAALRDPLKAALRDGGAADSAYKQQQAAEARMAALGAIFMAARSWTGSPEDHQQLGAWIGSLPNSVLPLDQVAELLLSAQSAKVGDVQGGGK